MGIQAFLVDADAEYRLLVGHHLTTRWPEAKISEYDPDASGPLPDGFSGAGCDLLIFGCPLDADGWLEWLDTVTARKKFPPVVILGHGGEREIVRAMRAGAADYISRESLSHSLFIEICEDALALAERRRDPAVSTTSISQSLGIPELKGFKVQKRISGGELASVYLTTDDTGRDVVLKVLAQVPETGGDVAFDRFLREFELIGKISHPNVVNIYDLGIADDHAYIAMEYCARGSLKRRINAGLEPERAEQIMREIAEALMAIHEVGILHRDLKPTNVLFREDDSVALIDFGLAKQAHLHAELTGKGEIFGTPYYMSPEQGHGEALDERSDIYSLGIVLYEMLTGKRPFEGDTAMAVIVRHARDPVPVLPEHLARYQPAIERMLAKRPEQRFQSVSELLQWRPATA